MARKSTKRGAPKQWTEARAIQLGDELIAWMEEDEGHLFLGQFAEKEGICKSRLTALAKEFDGFRELYARAKQIQEVRLLKGGIERKFDAGFTKFVLVNHHGYVSEHAKVDATNRNVNAEVEPTDEEWREFWAEQEKAGTGLDEDSLAE